MHYWKKDFVFAFVTYEIVHKFISKKKPSGKAEYIKNHTKTHIQNKNQNLFYTFNVNVRKYLISYV